MYISSNIDRQFAMWQILYPNAWFRDGDTPAADAGLAPFYKDQRKLWTSNDVVDWTTFRYGYDQLEPVVTARGTLETADERRSRVTQLIRDTYRSTANAADFASAAMVGPPLKPQFAGLAADEAPLQVEQDSSPAPAASQEASSLPAEPHTDVIEHPDYIVNVLYDR